MTSDPDPSDPPRDSFAPPYVDENRNTDAVEQGRTAAEDERRDAVADAYERAALRSEDPEAALDDIDPTEKEGSSRPAEWDAIRTEALPTEGD
jgi:hypothetical protein